LSLALLSEIYSIADATWAAQHGFSSQMNVFTPEDAGLDAATLQLIDVTGLNAALTPTAGTFSYEGLLKSLLNAGGASAGWTNIEWLGSNANETLTLTGYSNSSRSLKLDGGGGNDTLTGTTSADWILGGIGNDTLAGGNGNDSIEGGDGDDRLTGGVGQDTMDGDAGADTFAFLAGDSGTISGSVFDTITGFTVGAGGDRLDLAGTAAAQTNASGINVATASGNPGLAINAAIADGIISLTGSDSALVDTLGEWIGVARAVVTTNARAGAFAFGSDTYMYQENTGGDLLIKLTGLSGITSLSTSASSVDTIWIS
jgi:Ca2+-binding RTX toxin-like protein